MTALSPLSPGARPPLPTCAGPATGTPMDLPRGDTPLRAISEISKKTRRFLMRAIRHSIAKAALTGGGSRRHPAYIAAAQLADLADPNLHGLYDLDATEVAEALPTIRRAHIPGQLGELFAIAAAIAERAEFTEDIQGALQEVAAEYQAREVPSPTLRVTTTDQ